MSNPKHTPGPWEHDAAHKHGLVSLEVCIDTTVKPTGPIAIIYPVEGIEANERLANIRLIAAAPEMRRLLELNIDFLEGRRGSTEEFETWSNETRALLARIDGGHT